MSQDDAGSIEQLAGEIQEYLDRNPQAADTLEGIVAWWMRRQRFERSAQQVARALDHLVGIGAVKLYRAPGNRWLYCGRGRAEDIAGTLNSEGPMVAKIENLTDKPIWLRLNSGESITIAPHALSADLPEHEVDGNAQLNKLAERRTIARHSGGAKSAADAKSDKGDKADKTDKGDKGKIRRPE